MASDTVRQVSGRPSASTSLLLAVTFKLGAGNEFLILDDPKRALQVISCPEMFAGGVKIMKDWERISRRERLDSKLETVRVPQLDLTDPYAKMF